MSLKRQGVIFDMDGTLIEPAIDFAMLRQALGIIEGDILHSMELMSASSRERAAQIIESFEAKAALKMELRAGALELLKWLRARQIPSAIVTRNLHPRVEQLHALLGDHRFDPVIDRSFLPPKPHPASILHIVSHWGITPATAWMVGDSSHDLHAARGAGVSGVLIRHADNAHEEPHADLVIDRLDELIPHIERALSAA